MRSLLIFVFVVFTISQVARAEEGNSLSDGNSTVVVTPKSSETNSTTTVSSTTPEDTTPSDPNTSTTSTTETPSSSPPTVKSKSLYSKFKSGLGHCWNKLKDLVSRFWGYLHHRNKTAQE